MDICTAHVPSSQIPEIEAFVDKFLLGNDTVNTNIATTPYTTDLSPWITWTGPTLSNGTSDIEWTSLRYPTDLQTGLDSTVTFRWNKVQNAVQYIIQISSDPGFAVLDKSDSACSDTARTFTGLLKGKQYSWRVKPKSVAGVSLWSNIGRFITLAAPAKPHLLQATPVPDQAGYVTYSWNKVQDADHYSIQVVATQSPNRGFRSTTTTDTVQTFSGHSEEQQFSWQVQASNIAGAGPWSDVSTFTYSLTDVRQGTGKPTRFSLSQNFPNPFNPKTVIRGQWPGDSDVRLVVYDVLGRQVATLANIRYPAGKYSFTFDGANLASGVYLYRLTAGALSAVRTMLLIR